MNRRAILRGGGSLSLFPFLGGCASLSTSSSTALATGTVYTTNETETAHRIELRPRSSDRGWSDEVTAEPGANDTTEIHIPGNLSGIQVRVFEADETDPRHEFTTEFANAPSEGRATIYVTIRSADLDVTAGVAVGSF